MSYYICSASGEYVDFFINPLDKAGEIKYPKCTRDASTGNTRKERRRAMLRIDFRDARSIYEQVADGIEDMAMHGAMRAADGDGIVHQSKHYTARVQ